MEFAIKVILKITTMKMKIKSALKKVGFHIENKPTTFFDVVCGMEFSAANAEHYSDFDGKIYYFCSASCKNHFDGDPEKYAGA